MRKKCGHVFMLGFLNAFPVLTLELSCTGCNTHKGVENPQGTFSFCSLEQTEHLLFYLLSKEKDNLFKCHVYYCCLLF